MSQETNKTTINTSQQIHKISDNIPAVNKITEGIYGNTVSDHVKRVRDAFSRKMQYWNSDTNAAKDFKNTRKERRRSSNHFGIRLEVIRNADVILNTVLRVIMVTECHC